MKVLVISSVYPRSATDVEVPWMRESLRHIRAQGNEIEVLAPSWKGLQSHQIDGISVHRFRYAPASLEILTHDEGAPSKMANRPWLQLLAAPYIFIGFLLCFWRCLRFRPDVIHAHWPFPHGLMALAGKWFFRIPIVLNFHGAELLLIRKHPWVKCVLRFIIRRSDAVLANSSFTAQKIQQVHPCTVELSPYGTTLSNAAAPVAKCAQPFVALFVGRHIERKGLIYLLEAAALLPEQKFQIRIVGSGDLTESLKEFTAHRQIENVVFTGKLDKNELEQEYRSAHCFVLPAIVDSKGDTEGLGVVLIEAAELGLPLLASHVGGISDVVVDGVSGLLVPEKNPQAIADALQTLANQPQLAFKLVLGARELIAERFSWPGIVSKQLALYERLRQGR